MQGGLTLSYAGHIAHVYTTQIVRYFCMHSVASCVYQVRLCFQHGFSADLHATAVTLARWLDAQ